MDCVVEVLPEGAVGEDQVRGFVVLIVADQVRADLGNRRRASCTVGEHHVVEVETAHLLECGRASFAGDAQTQTAVGDVDLVDRCIDLSPRGS